MSIAEKCFKPMFGFCACVEHGVDKDDPIITFDAKTTLKLCQQLGEDFYTYLILFDNVCHEVVKVCQKDSRLFIEREWDYTSAREWPCGTQVKFDWTASAVLDLKSQVEPEDSCPETLFTGTVKNGNCVVRFKDGLAIEETPIKNQIQDACYENPVITMVDGCIEDIAEGADRVARYTSCDPGCCG